MLRLASLFTDYDTRTFLVPGDLIHHEKSLTEPLIERISWFRDEYPCELMLFKGNHDRFTRFPESWGILEEGHFQIQGFSFSHYYNPKVKAYQFSGHVHALIKLNAGFDSLRLPAFMKGPRHCLLPAFSKLTGDQNVKLLMGHQALVLTDVGIEVLKRRSL